MTSAPVGREGEPEAWRQARAVRPLNEPPSRGVRAGALLLAALSALCCLYAAILTGHVGAQDTGPSTAVCLARVAVAESGWDPSTGDAAAIAYLLQRRAQRRGLTTRRMARLYSANHFDAHRQHRRWIVGLTIRAERPEGWPVGLPWEGGYRLSWLAMLSHVHAVLRGEVEDPCPRSDHWGGAMDDWRAERAGWVRVQCSTPTRNRFWRDPRAGGAS